MALTVIGSVAYDSVQTDFGQCKNVLGGSATFASVGASFFSPVNLISVVGNDFSREHFDLLEKHGVNTEGLEVKKGKTFTWSAKYNPDLCHRKTLSVNLNVFEGFRPDIPKRVKRSDSLFLANIDPDLQDWIFKGIKSSGLVGCDTMDLWINTKKKELLKLLKKIDILFLNDEEARLMSGENSLLDAAKYIISKGAKMVVIKKGEHGALLFSKRLSFIVPPCLVSDVVDPTGAGDTFGGAMMGYLAKKKKITDMDLRRALVYGSILAAFTVEKFSVDGLVRAKKTTIDKRYKYLSQITKF